MKKIISLAILIVAFVLCLSACNTFQRCPAYSDVQTESAISDKV
ncbi:MAG: hypothetical protein WC142_05775 [Bacteroidales bacterium]|jgi:hypothetical protein|nr:hypothetical protein [Bacteroidales bacterium]MDD2687164.1 hypothetical protein [Bacteroidales bacterium]MDD3330798.1 hypothetical protein [Bacteroidales bacterium]MDD3691503.1 hypothetical protein [Bacteroidales bacterium]MDD4044964.1 hypothetical protein [Bacteroidales bacterium]